MVRKKCTLDVRGRIVIAKKNLYSLMFIYVMTSELLENANSINLMKRKVKKFLTRLATTALSMSDKKETLRYVRWKICFYSFKYVHTFLNEICKTYIYSTFLIFI